MASKGLNNVLITMIDLFRHVGHVGWDPQDGFDVSTVYTATVW